eukprot:c22041_g1_i1 orf=58-2154(-)
MGDMLMAADVDSCQLPEVATASLAEGTEMVVATTASEADATPPVAALASEHREGGCLTLRRKQLVGLNKNRCPFSLTSQVGEGTESSSLGHLVVDPKVSALARLGLRTSNESGEYCAACGGGGDGRILHRLRHQGALRQLCSSCILFFNRGMYCSICFQVDKDQKELGFTCCKCFRLSHIECLRKLSPCTDLSSSVCIDCSRPNSGPHISGSQARESSLVEGLCVKSSSEVTNVVDRKKPQMNFTAPSELKEPGLDSGHATCSFLKFDWETLTAAKVVAFLSAKEAADAKARAVAMAGVAAKAATRAKTALDAAYRAGKEEGKVNVEAPRHFVTVTSKPSFQSTGLNSLERRKYEKMDLRTARNKQGAHVIRTFPSIHKRKALSAIAGTEKYTALASSGLEHSYKQQPKAAQLDSDEVKLQEYLYSVQDVAEQSHEELGRQVVALAGSEGLLTTSSCLDILQGPLHLLTHGACPSTSERDLADCVSQGNIAINGVQGSSNLICDITGCMVMVPSSQYDNTEVGQRLFLGSKQTLQPDLGGKLQFQDLAEENIPDRGFMASELPLDAVSSGMDVASENISGNDITSSLLDSNSQLNISSGIPDEQTKFYANLGIYLEESNGTQLIGDQGGLAHKASTSVADATINQANQGPGIQINSNTSGQDHADKFCSNVGKSSVGVVFPIPLPMPALTGMPTIQHL